MKILLVTAEPPLPLGHVSARWYHVLVEQLIKAGHQVDVLSACAKPEEIKECERLFRNKSTARFFGFPHSQNRGLIGKAQSFFKPGSYQFSNLFMTKFKELAKECDVIHGEQLSTGIPLLESEKPKLINVHNLIGLDRANENLAGVYEKIVHQRQSSLETQLIKNFTHMVAVSDELKAKLEGISPSVHCQWVPFGIDAKLYLPAEGKREFHFGMIGNMNWRPSFSAAENVINLIWPEIIRKKPEAKMLIAGWNAKQRLAQYMGTPGLVIKENVKDIREIFQEIETLIYFPKEGSGVKVKVLEALLMKCAVVTNSVGMEGLAPSVSEFMVAEEAAEKIVERALALMENPQERSTRGSTGRQYVMDFHAGPSSLKILEGLYQKLLDSK